MVGRVYHGVASSDSSFDRYTVMDDGSSHFHVVIGLFFVVVFMRTLGVPAEARSQ